MDSFSEDGDVLKYTFEVMIAYIESKEHESSDSYISQGLLPHNLDFKWNKPAGMLIEVEGADPLPLNGANEVVPRGPDRSLFSNIAIFVSTHPLSVVKNSIYKRIVARKSREEQKYRKGSRSKSTNKSVCRATELGKRQTSKQSNREISELRISNNKRLKMQEKTTNKKNINNNDDREGERSLFNLTEQDPEPIVYSLSRRKEPQRKRSIGRVVRDTDESHAQSKRNATPDKSVDKRRKHH